MGELLATALGVLAVVPILAAAWCVQWLLWRRQDRRAAAARAAAELESRTRFLDRIADARRRYPEAAKMLDQETP